MAEECVKSGKDASAATVHAGHRQRIRERYRKQGLDGFAPHEVLELLLFYCRARGDVNPLAHRLIDRFGSLRGVLEAEYSQLMNVPGVGEETATLISMIVPLFRRYAAAQAEKQNAIHNRSEARRYCIALQAGRRKESFFVICLNNNPQVTGQRLISEGTPGEVQAYPRVVIETALNLNAQGVLLCHNHPGGIAAPSQADIDVTQQLEMLLTELGIKLLDHIIVAGETAYSMADEGLICQPEDEPLSAADLIASLEKLIPKNSADD